MAPNPIDYFAIQNTISRYCIALDTKNFNLLQSVFSQEVEAKYPLSSHGFKGERELAAAIEKRLAPVTSQHALTTQTIEVAEDGKSANATTYFTGIHFGKGKWQGQQVTAWGKYMDSLVLIESEESLPGASGHWLIEKRQLEIMGRLGEEGVMDGE